MSYLPRSPIAKEADSMKMIVESKWFDLDGNIKPRSTDISSENGSTFNAMAHLLAGEAGVELENFDITRLNANKHETNEGQYLTNDFDIKKVKDWESRATFKMRIADIFKLSHSLKLERSPERFSHDETNSVVATSFYEIALGNKQIRNTVNLNTVQERTRQTWYRPHDVGVATSYAKNPDRPYLIPIIEFFSKLSLDSTSKDANGDYHASGKVQAWIRIVGLGLDLQGCIKDMPEENGLVTMFSNFIKEEDHIINVLARKAYGA